MRVYIYTQYTIIYVYKIFIYKTCESRNWFIKILIELISSCQNGFRKI